MDYKRLFERLKCYSLVMFDDEFITPKPSKSRIIRDFATMDIDDQSVLVEELSKEAQDLAGQLKAFIEPINQFFSQIDWKKDILIDDFESAFSVIEKKINNKIASDLKEKYTTIDESELLRYYPLFMRYGLCISIPSCYQSIIEEYEQGGRRKKLRTYSDFTSKTQESFEKELRQSSIEKTVICIVDNCLTDRDKAQEILECINSIGSSGSNIIGTIFTSKDSFERVDERLCFVCTPKSKANQLALNIVRSAYHYFLARLQDEISENINEVFKKAKENKHIANFLSQRAVREGISNYEVMQNWIKLLYEVHSAQSDATKRLIGLAQIIDELEDDEDLSFMEDSLLDDLNTWEIFDYRVNDYHLPPMPGDLFVTADNTVYVLIGQDCDMMMSETRKRRIASAELLPVRKLIPMSTPNKVDNDLEYVWFANYKHVDNEKYCLQIDYKQRKFIDSRILDLCAYNSDGSCYLDTQHGMNDSIRHIIQPFLIGHYESISRYFDALRVLKGHSPEGLGAILNNDQFLYTTCEYAEEEKGIRFPLKRICRLKQTYVFFLYKLYLEYRGRQPFETINYAALLSQKVEMSCGDKKTTLEISVRLGSHSYDAKIERLAWFVDKGKLRTALKQVGIDEKIVSTDNKIALYGVESEVLLQNSQKIKFTKIKGNKASVILET